MDIRIWLVAEQQDEKGCYDGAVLANSDISPTLYVTLMSAKDSPVPEILTLPEVEPTSVWMLNELKMHRDP